MCVNYNFKPRSKLDIEDPFDRELLSHAQGLINMVESNDDLRYVLTFNNQYTDLARYVIEEGFHAQEDIEKLIERVVKFNLEDALESLIHNGFKGINENSRFDLNIALKRRYITSGEIRDKLR
ncbi:MAG: hypothetical protein LAT82_03600 [Nanoarchaeota archaeon]|nr:hypothetical protein [Nanoarchaeota archaeon]